MRKLIGQGQREDRVLVFALLACLMIFVAQVPRLWLESVLDTEIPFIALVSASLFGWMFLAPLLLYALAGLVHLGARMLRRQSSPYTARLALFWALLSAAPIWMLHGAFRATIPGNIVTGIVGFVGLCAFVIILWAGLREAAQPPSPSNS
jgi:hypothetical protein